MFFDAPVFGVSPPVQTFTVSTLLSCALGFPVYVLLSRLQVVDAPNPRSSHTEPTVRGGGIAILLAFVAVICWIPKRQDGALIFVLLAAMAFLSVISFIDDLKSLPVGIRFGCQAFVGLVALFTLRYHFSHVSLLGSISSGWLHGAEWLVLFFWIAGYTNAFNFMDGINGIAATQCLVTALGSGILAGVVAHRWADPPVIFSFALAGAAAGFLPYNFPQARMFMGDVSSAPIGFLLATLALWIAAAYGRSLIVPLALLHANFILDTSITLLRRIIRRERWRESHREHFYQRLVRAGKTHVFVTNWETGLQCLVLLLALGYVLHRNLLFQISVVLAVTFLWLVFFFYCEIQLRKSSSLNLAARSDGMALE